MNQAPLPDEDDLQLVKEYLLLPVLLDVLERDSKILDTILLKMHVIYLKALQHVQDKITLELSCLRNKIREHGIKVYEQRRTSLSIETQYVYRGYHHHFSMLWSLVKAELQIKLSVYFNIDLRSNP